MSTRPGWPRRPAPLIVGLVLVVLAALLYAMAATSTAGLGRPNSGMSSVVLLIGLLAVRFNWARFTVAVLLGLQTIVWLPGAFAVLGSDQDYYENAVAYVFIAAVFTVVGLVLLFHPRANAFYAGVRARRAERGRVQS